MRETYTSRELWEKEVVKKRGGGDERKKEER